MKQFRRARIALLGVLTGAALFAALPGVASAGVLVQSAPNCDNGVNTQPFQRWGDENWYFLAPGGSFEGSLDGWNVGRASVVNDQEPWRVHSDGSKALRIPAGGSVVTSTMCVGLEHPTMRFFAHRAGGGLLGSASQLIVTARVETSLGLVVEVPVVGAVNALTGNGTNWNKTPTHVVAASLLPLLPGEHTPIQFRFTAVGTGDWVIDDVFVDPRARA